MYLFDDDLGEPEVRKFGTEPFKVFEVKRTIGFEERWYVGSLDERSLKALRKIWKETIVWYEQLL